MTLMNKIPLMEFLLNDFIQCFDKVIAIVSDSGKFLRFKIIQVFRGNIPTQDLLAELLATQGVFNIPF